MGGRFTWVMERGRRDGEGEDVLVLHVLVGQLGKVRAKGLAEHGEAVGRHVDACWMLESAPGG